MHEPVRAIDDAAQDSGIPGKAFSNEKKESDVGRWTGGCRDLGDLRTGSEMSAGTARPRSNSVAVLSMVSHLSIVGLQIAYSAGGGLQIAYSSTMIVNKPSMYKNTVEYRVSPHLFHHHGSRSRK
jgi:hypothetical protein